MILSIIILVIGLVALVKGADYLVDGSSAIARRFGISSLVIGLTVVAFGTSAPELSVSVLSALSRNAEIALGNVSGSNVANILLILGCTGLIAVIPVKSRTVIKELPYMILAELALIVLIADRFLTGYDDTLSRADGLILLGFFAIFLYYLILSAKHIPDEQELPKRSVVASVFSSIFGLIGLIIGAQMTVNGAVSIAESLGISQVIIAVTVIAVGTSLPELVTSIVAARKKETDIAIGNVVGSNIFNILLVLGLSASLSPESIPVSVAAFEDAMFSFIAMVILLIAILWPRHVGGGVRKGIGKWEAMLFLLLYLAYIAYIVIRG